MKHHRIIIAATMVGFSVFASRAGAAIIVTDGMLHAYGGGGAAPDQPFVPPQTGISAIPGMGWESINNNTYATETVALVDGGVRISTNMVGPLGYVSASGSLSITEDEPEDISVRLSINPFNPSYYDPYYSHRGSVRLYGTGGNYVFSPIYTYLRPFQFLGPLNPGQYTLDWSDGGINGVYNAGIVLTLTAPEPSSALLIIPPVAAALMRRRRSAEARR
jgi:hypothetical protein